MRYEEKHKRIQGEAAEFLSKQLEIKTREIQNNYSRNRENILNEFNSRIAYLTHETKRLQDEKMKGPIHCFCLSFLRSGLYTKNHVYLISLYDSNFYMDKNKIHTYWKPDFIMDCFEEDIKELIEYLHRKFNYISNFDIEQIRQWYVYNYYFIARRFYEEHVEEVMYTIKVNDIEMTKDFNFLFGGYMERMTII